MSWETAELRQEIDKSVDGYAAKVASRRIAVEVEHVTAVMRLDGGLADLEIDPRAMRDNDAESLGDLLADVIRAAEREAEVERDALADSVTFRGLPVLELVELMMTDPAEAARRFNAGADMRR